MALISRELAGLLGVLISRWLSVADHSSVAISKLCCQALVKVSKLKLECHRRQITLEADQNIALVVTTMPILTAAIVCRVVLL